MKTMVFDPRAFRSLRASSINVRISLIAVLVAEKVTNRARVLLAMIRASVVLPEPGGPQKIIEGMRSLSMAVRRNRPSPRSSSRPTTSSSVRGRRRSGRGASDFAGGSKGVVSKRVIGMRLIFSRRTALAQRRGRRTTDARIDKVRLVDVGIQLDGVGIQLDGVRIRPDGVKIRPDGVRIQLDGVGIRPDGVRIQLDGVGIRPEFDKVKRVDVRVRPDSNVRLSGAREGAHHKLSPALGAGKKDAAEFRGREGGHHKMSGPGETL